MVPDHIAGWSWPTQARCCARLGLRSAALMLNMVMKNDLPEGALLSDVGFGKIGPDGAPSSWPERS
jgi:hypothetical protein